MPVQDYHVLVQAREGSSRLPNKTLMPILKYSLISSVIFRFSRSQCSVLTGLSNNNQRLAAHISSSGYDVRFGSETNVFERFAEFARNSDVKYLVRVTGDNPFVYIDCIDEMINLIHLKDLDYCISENLPIGCAIEIFKRKSLLELEKLGIDDFTKEHVTSNFYSSKSLWRWLKYNCNFSSISSLRLTVDTKLDLDLIRNICKYFNREAYQIRLTEIEKLHHDEPNFFNINKSVRQKSFRELE